mmetsp:Transcript_3688/g.11645  ORF Transcript_3688/g.11645 Transcript_3688/m.11645 type:complete len:297 (-) Transcript_3688:18-908(-)
MVRKMMQARSWRWDASKEQYGGTREGPPAFALLHDGRPRRVTLRLELMLVLREHAPDHDVVDQIGEAGDVLVLQQARNDVADAREPHQEDVAAVLVQAVVAAHHVAVAVHGAAHAAEGLEAQATLLVPLRARVAALRAARAPHAGAAVVVLHIVEEELLALLAHAAPRAAVAREAHDGLGAARGHHRRLPLVRAVLLDLGLRLRHPVVGALLRVVVALLRRRRRVPLLVVVAVARLLLMAVTRLLLMAVARLLTIPRLLLVAVVRLLLAVVALLLLVMLVVVIRHRSEVQRRRAPQ